MFETIVLMTGLYLGGQAATWITLAYCQTREPPTDTQWARLCAASYWVAVALFTLGHAGPSPSIQSTLILGLAAGQFVRVSR